MIQHIRKPSERQRISDTTRASNQIVLVLWSLWTLVVIATAFYSWRVDMLAQRPLDLIGLTIHCAVVGIIALIALTLVEMRIQPWRF